MFTPVLRRTVLFWIVSTILILGTNMTLLHADGATVTYQSVDRYGTNYHYYDHLTGVQVMAQTPLAGVSRSQVWVDAEDGQQLLQITDSNETHIVGQYPLRPQYEWALWLDVGETILLVHREGSPAETVLSLVGVNSGVIEPFLRLPQFSAGNISLSPNGHHLLLRENADSPLLATGEQAHRLVDLPNGEITELAPMIYAYWSPDSQYLLFGRGTEETVRATVEVYEIASQKIQPLDLTIAQPLVTFFWNFVPEHDNGLLWSPDSASFALYDDTTQTLLHVSRDGTVLRHIDTNRLYPTQWSPDKRYLVATGVDEGHVGAFILDMQSGAVSPLKSDRRINTALADFSWSPDSRTLAVLARTSGVRQQVTLSLYDRQGNLVASPQMAQSPENHFVAPVSFGWVSS